MQWFSLVVFLATRVQTSSFSPVAPPNTVWELYQEAASIDSMRPMGYSIFTRLWRELLPYIVVMQPMTDLCWRCQRNSAAITRSSNRPVEEKSMVCVRECVCNSE